MTLASDTAFEQIAGVDEVCLTLAPRFVGGEAGRIAQGGAESDRRFSLAGVVTDEDGFVFLRYVAV